MYAVVSNQMNLINVLSSPKHYFSRLIRYLKFQLSYYRSQAEMAHTCRGTISLHGAHIQTEDSCNFVVSNGGGTQVRKLARSITDKIYVMLDKHPSLCQIKRA